MGILNHVAVDLATTKLEAAKIVVSAVSPIITFLGFAATTVGIIIAVRQLRNTSAQISIAADNLRLSREQNASTQKWKRNEFLAGEVKTFLLMSFKKIS